MFHLTAIAVVASSHQTVDLTINPFISLVLPFIGTVIGGIIATSTAIIGILLTNKQQIKRDKQAYARSVKEAKRERIRSSYKVILNATEEYQSAVGQIRTKGIYDQQLNASLREALADVNLTMVGITLEGIDFETVKPLFYELRSAFDDYVRSLEVQKNYASRGETPAFTNEKINEKEESIINKGNEVKMVMQEHLRELEA